MKTKGYQVRIAAAAVAALTGVILMTNMNPAPGETATGETASAVEAATKKLPTDDKLEKVTFGTGCFWCTEAVFAELKGVKSAVSGYSGGRVLDPTYKQVCTGTTGHAEVIQVTYDPQVISFPELLEVFWQIHDPTTLNRQGADIGTQYRSAIFYHTEEQQKLAEKFKKKLNDAGAFSRPIVTEIAKFEKFYPAEDYHQEYFAANPNDSYCQAVIRPKVEKFRKVFAAKLKDSKEQEKK